MRLVGTTKSTIEAIRERTHWNSANLTPLDPVTLGLCSQIDLDLEVQHAAKEKPVPAEAQGATLLPASVTTAPKEEPEPDPAPRAKKRRRSQRRGRVRQAQATRRQGRIAIFRRAASRTRSRHIIPGLARASAPCRGTAMTAQT